MEQKLREYRALRRRKELIDNTKEKIEKTKNKLFSFLVPKFLTNMKKDKDEKDEEVLLIEEEPHTTENQATAYEYEEPVEAAAEAGEAESSVEQNPESWRYFIIKWTIYSVIWITGYIFFLNQGFGAVFFAISALVAICLNTRTRRKKPGEVSAYSVFNRNCESIDGTLKAEDLQRQMLLGAGGIQIF